MLRARLSRTTLLILTLAAFCASIAVVAFFQMRDGGSPSASHELPSIEALATGTPYKTYYFEARVTWGSTTQGPEDRALFIRGWYEAPGRTRWDLFPASARNEPENTRVVISSEKEFIYYEPDKKAYSRQPSPTGTVLQTPMPMLSNLAVGPLVSYLAGANATFIKSETLLGRQTDLFEGVAGTSTVSTTASGAKITSQTATGTMRFWIDQQHQFVLKQVRDASDKLGSFIAEITKVEYDKPLPKGIFDFPAPPNARRVPQSLVFDPPFLSPSYLPDGLVSVGARFGGGGPISGRAKSEERALKLADGELVIHQEYGGPATELQEGSLVSVNGNPGRATTVTKESQVTWRVGDISIVVKGPLPLEEILKIAESMR